MGCIKFFNFLIRKFTQPRANQRLNNKEKGTCRIAGGVNGLRLASSTQIYTFSKRVLITS